jgi:hypothetical protein
MTNEMKNLILMEYTPHMMGGDIHNIGNVIVSNFDELYDIIVRDFVGKDKEEWEQDLKYFYKVDTVSEMKVHMLEGSFDSDFFVVWLAEEWQIICMTSEKYDELLDNSDFESDYDILEYIDNELIPNIDVGIK